MSCVWFNHQKSTSWTAWYTFLSSMSKEIMMKSIAITGTIGSGKSACSQILREAGFQVFDCDKECHAYLKIDGLLYQRVIDLLGTSILSEDGTIDRKKVADLIFSDLELKKKYEQMFHDELKVQLKHEIASCELFIAEVPLLFETVFNEKIEKLAPDIFLNKDTTQSCSSKTK